VQENQVPVLVYTPLLVAESDGQDGQELVPVEVMELSSLPDKTWQANAVPSSSTSQLCDDDDFVTVA